MYKYLQLDRPPDARVHAPVRSWSLSCSGKGCGLNLRYCRLNNLQHTHFSLLDRLRDASGPSECFLCGVCFDDSASLRRHITTECPCVHDACPHCGYYDTRDRVRVHIRDTHESVCCPCCNAHIAVKHWSAHVQQHRRDLYRAQVTESKRWIVSADGVCRERALA